MESDIGNRAKKEIQQILNQKLDENVDKNRDLNRKINKLLRQVGPGEWLQVNGVGNSVLNKKK